MITENNFQKAIDLLKESKNILVTTHTRPDGDACGSLIAITEAVKSLGKSVKMILLDELPQWYEFLFDEKPAVFNRDINAEKLKGSAIDLIILVDVNSDSQLPGFCDFLKQNKKKVLVIDHHVSTDGLGDLELHDTAAAAAGIIVYDLLNFAKIEITEKIALALFVAIATDTGWFRFANTDSKALHSCAELMQKGVDPAAIYKNLYQSFTSQRFALMTVMLNSLELHLDGRYAAQHITQADFQSTGAEFKDTENLIDECQRVSSVEVAALFVESPDGRIKCSLRSRGPVDVRQIAQTFGGGGHKMAAGTHLSVPMEKAKQLIFTEIEKQLPCLP